MSTSEPAIPFSLPTTDPPAWKAAGQRFHGYGFNLRRRFGRTVRRISLDAGFTCPNVDGTVATGGCVFCDNRSFSPSRRLPRTSILGQLDEGIRRVQLRYEVDRFIAYFQPATNTYAPVDRLRPLFESPLAHEKVVGLAIGTRPDCVPDDVVRLLEDLGRRTYLSVELGLQSVHDRSLDWMNRGHYFRDFEDAVSRCQGLGFELCVHVILGLPGESHEDMLTTAREVARLRLDAVKLHNLYVVRNTPMAEQYLAGELPLMEQEQYVHTVVDFLELLPPECVVERVQGEAPPDYFLGPDWCLEKASLRSDIDAEFRRRNSWQGSRFDGSALTGAAS